MIGRNAWDLALTMTQDRLQMHAAPDIEWDSRSRAHVLVVAMYLKWSTA